MRALIPYFEIPILDWGPIVLDSWTALVMMGFVVGLEITRARAIRLGLDVRDIVDGVVAAAERGTRGERYLLTGHHASFLELASCAAAITGVPRPRLVVPTWLAHVGVPFVSLWASIRRGRRSHSGSTCARVFVRCATICKRGALPRCE